MSRIISYRDALNEAFATEMRRDPRVFTYGIDVADHKRIFGSTKGLLEEFGPDRCFSTPLSEDAMTGFGLGAALNGYRPIHVHMRVDFMILALNQITNMIASFSYGAGGFPVPMVIRAIIGRGWGQSWQHSKTLHSWFAHVPGLKVLMPARARDARDMMIAAIRDDNPVVIIEHRWLYDVVGEVPEDTADLEPMLGSKVVRPGKDVTVVAVSWMVVEALKAAEVLDKHGVSLEVVDVRSLAPYDDAEVLRSVNRTGHAIVADYDWIHCGFGAEVAVRIYEQCSPQLKSPVQRIGFAEAHCPCTRPLENAYYANAIDIIRGVEKKLNLPEIDLSDEEFFSYEKKFKGPF